MDGPEAGPGASPEEGPTADPNEGPTEGSAEGPLGECLFCRIVAGEVPADIVADSDSAVAFRDIDPQAPLHVLVVPRIHASDAAALADREPVTVAELLRMAGQLASDEGHTSYRLVFNTGDEAGQTVFHTHLHLLAGRRLTWPPG